MAMNREQKRAMQRAGQLSDDGTPVANRERRPQAPRADVKRTPPRQFLREVVAELRKVSWPNRPEVIRYSTIVFIALVVFTLIIFGLDFAFGSAVRALFNTTPSPTGFIAGF